MTNEIIEIIDKVGLGVVSFAFLLFIFYRASKWADTLLNNHLNHLIGNLEELNLKMDRFIALAEKIVDDKS